MDEKKVSSDRETSVLALMFARKAENPAVCVVDGIGAEIGTAAGRLIVRDGIGRSRRTRTYARATHELARVVVLAGSGSITLDAIRWLDGASVGWIVIDPKTQEVMSTSVHVSIDDARVRRAQALALGSGVAVEVARRLIRHKLAGQSAVARIELADAKAADSIDDLADCLVASASLEEVRQLEAAAANVYWNAWSATSLVFVKRDSERVPSNWLGFDGRKSAIGPYSARNATDPLNALLNYSYKLVEAEGSLAAQAVGLDPGMGLLHADMRGRQSLVLDLMEAARPIADRHILRLAREHPMRWRDFKEDERGVVRVLPPLTHRLAEAMPSYARALGPIVQEVADLFASSSPYDFTLPHPLLQERHREISRRSHGAPSGEPRSRSGPGVVGVPPRKARRQSPRPASREPHLPSVVCKVCGKTLQWEPDRRGTRARYCTECTPGRRVEIGRMIQAMPKQSQAASPETRAKRIEVNRARRLAELAWDREHAGEARDQEWYLNEVLPGLRDLSLTTIAKATGLSTSAASKIRSGQRVPHPRWWSALQSVAKSRRLGPDES